MKSNLIACLLLACVVCSVRFVAADDLDDLFEGLPPAEKRPTAKEPAAGQQPSIDDLPVGEDIDLSGERDPFARIATKMQRSQQALSTGKVQEQTQELQKEILLDLDALLKNMEKKCQGGQCNKPGSKTSSGSTASGTKPSQKPAADSTNRVGQPGDTKAADEQAAADALREVWGHLPPKLREAMQNVRSDEFLPKYDRLIEEFYRRLAEQPPRGG